MVLSEQEIKVIANELVKQIGKMCHCNPDRDKLIAQIKTGAPLYCSFDTNVVKLLNLDKPPTLPELRRPGYSLLIETSRRAEIEHFVYDNPEAAVDNFIRVCRLE